MLRLLVFVFAVALVAGCNPVERLAGPPVQTAAAEFHGGALVVKAGVDYDTVANQWQRENRFAQTWRGLREGTLMGVHSVEVTLFLRANRAVVPGSERTGLLQNGIFKSTWPKEMTVGDVGLCVFVPDDYRLSRHERIVLDGNQQAICTGRIDHVIPRNRNSALGTTPAEAMGVSMALAKKP